MPQANQKDNPQHGTILVVDVSGPRRTQHLPAIVLDYTGKDRGKKELNVSESEPEEMSLFLKVLSWGNPTPTRFKRFGLKESRGRFPPMGCSSAGSRGSRSYLVDLCRERLAPAGGAEALDHKQERPQ